MTVAVIFAAVVVLFVVAVVVIVVNYKAIEQTDISCYGVWSNGYEDDDLNVYKMRETERER